MAKTRRLWLPGARLFKYFYAFAAVAAVAILCYMASAVIDYRSVGMFLLFTVSLLALILGPGPVLLAAALSAFIWNFLFIPPRMTFNIHEFSDALMVGMYFIIALVGGILTARVRVREMAVRRREEQTLALYDLAKEINRAGSLDDMIQTAIRQLAVVFQARSALFLVDESKNLCKTPHATGTFAPAVSEWEAALQAFKNHKAATAKAVYYPLLTSNGAVGVVGIHTEEAFTPEQEGLLETFLHQIAVALERELLRNVAAQASLLAESERLHKTLLNSVSHELRTPLATVTGASSSLLEMGTPGNQTWKILVGDIFTAAQRLNRLVKNLLDMSRLESGMVKLHLEWCDAEDLVSVVMRNLEGELINHKVELDINPELPLVRLDFVLMEQVLSNILLNAALHTPAGTIINLGMRVDDEKLMIDIEDDGPGFPPQTIEHIFDKFYRLPKSTTGGTGLGLSISRGFVEAHGGAIYAQNREGHGARFVIQIPVATAPRTPEEEI